MICAKCGKDFEKICSICWRCENCGGDCKNHMVRIIDGIIGKNKSSKNYISRSK